MSLAYKLWKIGNVLTEDDIKNSIKIEPKFQEDIEPVYLNIDFKFANNELVNVSLNKEAINIENLFFTKKIGGTSNAFYLYPNIILQKEKPIKGIKNITNTLRYSTRQFCVQKYKNDIDLILNKLDNLNDFKKLENYKKDNYIIWISINGETFSNLMPEVWENYYQHPFIDCETKRGFDIFTNEETEIGYKTDFKIFSYDQYHSSLQYRIDYNLSLSKDSARNIKYAWMYILDNLVFYYKGLEYVIIPNLITDDKEALKLILSRLVKANNKTSNKRTVLEILRKEEKEFIAEINKIQKEKRDTTDLNKNLKKIQEEIFITDKGIISEFNEQANALEEFINSVTLDYLFVTVNRTNLSFEINGTIEDVIPSRMSQVVKKMREFKVEDLVKLGAKDREKTYLQDFFDRDELCFALNRNSKENANRIFTERFYLSKLLLTNIKIEYNDLLKRFEFNRLYGYDHKKRVKDGIQEWISYSSSFIKEEETIIQFLKSIKKIQED